jgi:hypothetical protein
MWRVAAAVCILGCIPGTTDASAQVIFLQGSYGADVRRFSADEGQEVFDGSASNLALAGGGFVTPRWTVGIELAVGGSSLAERSVTVPIAGRPETVTTSYTLERRSLSALAGFHTAPAHRVRLGCYAGLSFSTVRREISADAPTIGLTPPPEPSIFTDRTTAPVVGVDVAVTIAPAVAIVGSLRGQGLALVGDLTGFSIRPSGGLRVTF